MTSYQYYCKLFLYTALSNMQCLMRKLQKKTQAHCDVKLVLFLMKKRSRETQTLRSGCSKAEPKIFAPPQTLFPGGAGWPKFNQLEMVTTFTYRPSLVRIDARNFVLSWLTLTLSAQIGHIVPLLLLSTVSHNTAAGPN